MKAEKRVKKIIDTADVLVEVLDARFPEETRIKSLENLVKSKGKPLIIVLNKCDLVPKEFAEKWKMRLAGVAPTVFVSSKQRKGTKILRSTIKKVSKKLPVVVGLFGYPNVGKSSLVNVLKGKGVAGVSPKAGYTRGEQMVKISKKIYIIDTPGVIYPKDEVTLALIGCIEPEKMDDPETAAERILKAFGKTLENYAKEKNFLTKGGIPDTRRAAIDVLHKWQRGRLDKLNMNKI